MGVVVFCLVAWIFYVGLESFGIHLNVASLAVFSTLLLVSSHVILTPGNLGVPELAYGYLAHTMSFGVGQAVLVAAIVRVFSYLVLFALAIPMGG